MAGPLRTDPSRTAWIVKRWIAALQARLQRLARAIDRLVVEEDAFGLKQAAPIVQNTRWRFLTDADKIEAFQDWLSQQVSSGVLGVPAGTRSRPWISTYVSSAYRQAAVRAYVDSHAEDFTASQEQFLRDAFDAPEVVSKLRLLSTRAFTNLKGVTDQMAVDLSRSLADGLAHGHSPLKIARGLRKTLGFTKARAERIARTEVIHAHAEGQLDTLEMLGVEEVTLLVEWATADDDKVCPLCSPLGGTTYTIEEARGLIPRHPNCRCAWIPANVGEKTAGQKRRRRDIERSLLKSVRAEVPTAKTAKAALRESRWTGADLKIKSRRK